MCSHRSPRGDRKSLKEESVPLFVLFVLFGQAKRTLKEKYHKGTFLFLYFCMTKSTKSQQGGLTPSSFRTSCGVHELVARSSAWQVCTARDKSKIGGFAAPRNLILPRVRTYHTKKPSRFVHALSARPLKVQGGRGEVCTLTKSGHFASLHLRGIDRFAKQTRSASPRLGQKVAREA